jgi:polygalacturonase
LFQWWFLKNVSAVNLTCHATVLRSNVTISGVTILAPLNSPNTDGIDPGR